MGETVRVTGYKETIRSLKDMERGTAAAIRLGLRQAAQPIADDAKQLIGAYPGASLGTIGPRVNQRGVSISQRAKKRTGHRPDFGALQMTAGLLPALDEHEDDVVRDVTEAVDILIARSGFRGPPIPGP